MDLLFNAGSFNARLVYLISLPVVVLASIFAYNAVFYLILFVKTREKTLLWFTLNCFSAVIFSIGRTGVYLSSHVEQAMFWQRMQFASGNFLFIFSLWFYWSFFQVRNKKIPVVLSAIFIIFFLLGITTYNELTLSVTSNTSKELGIANLFTLHIFEGEPGLIYIMRDSIMFFLIIFLFVYTILNKNVESKNKRYEKIFLISLSIFCLAAVSDILMSLGFYKFIYLIEYSYSIVLLSMNYFTVLNLRGLYKEFKQLSLHDPLTNLPNRRSIIEYYDKECARINQSLLSGEKNKAFSIAVIDIDNFKKVNDRYGHNCGDHVLVVTGEVIQATLRNQDIVGRWGGEEFIVILKNTDINDATIILEEVRKEIEKTTFSYGGISSHITITIGVSEYIDPKLSMEKIVGSADQALLKGKKTGKNKVIQNEVIQNEVIQK